MADDDAGDAFRGHWLTFLVDLYLADHTPDRPPITIELRAGEQPMHLRPSTAPSMCASEAPSAPMPY